ncbi:hypothetical protein [Vagococcus fluvialis]|uniref:hypothetical protein n=1 Tax=Vagococcus fluvialis TaxID=2738 RepID=UPI002B2B9517|nr:hypothetical protein QDW48_04755 [Vagococcus fluvialis]
MENVKVEQNDLNEKKEERFVMFGTDKTGAIIWVSPRMWLLSAVDNTRGTDYKDYFKVPLVESVQKLSNQDRTSFYCWLTVINRFNQNISIDGYNEENKPRYKYDYYVSKDSAIAYFLFHHSNEIDNNKKTTIRKSFDRFVILCEQLDEVDVIKTKDNKSFYLSINGEIFNSIHKTLFDTIVENSICQDFQITKRHISAFYAIMTSAQVKPMKQGSKEKRNVRTISSVCYKTFENISGLIGISTKSFSDSVRFLINHKIISVLLSKRVIDNKPEYRYYITDCFHEIFIFEEYYIFLKSGVHYQVMEISKTIGRETSEDYPWDNYRVLDSDRIRASKYSNSNHVKTIKDQIKKQRKLIDKASKIIT